MFKFLERVIGVGPHKWNYFVSSRTKKWAKHCIRCHRTSYDRGRRYGIGREAVKVPMGEILLGSCPACNVFLP